MGNKKQKKYEVANQEIWFRFLEDTVFIEELKKFRNKTGLPPEGFDENEPFYEWLESDKHKERLDKFITGIIKKTKMQAHARLLQTILKYYVPLGDNFHFLALFYALGHGCELFDGEIINQKVDKLTKERIANGVLILVTPESSKRKLIEAINDSVFWSHAQEMLDKKKKSYPQVRSTKRDRDKLVLQAHKEKIINANGLFTKEYNILSGKELPKQYKFLKKMSIDRRRDIIHQQKKKKTTRK